MKFERESWRKLYIVESAEHRLLPMFTRGMRDYLLRLASDDGTVLRASKSPKKDLQRLLNVEAAERTAVDRGFDDLLRIGYLSNESGRVWITRFAEAQEARSPGAKRQAKYRDARRNGDSSPPASPDASREASPNTSPSDAHVTSQIDETRRDETRSPKPPVAATLADRARAVLENPHDGQWQQPSKWPETLAVCAAWSFGMVIKLRDYPPSDSDLRAILEAFRDGFDVAELVDAGKRAASSDYFRGLKSPGPAAFTAAVLRRLMARERSDTSASGPENGGYGSSEGFVA